MHTSTNLSSSEVRLLNKETSIISEITDHKDTITASVQ